MEKQLIIGRGRWADKISDILNNSFNIKTDRITRDYATLNLDMYEKIYIIIPPQHNMEVLDYCLKNSKADIYIEKPLSLSSKNVPEFINNRIFVGNKFIYSPSIKSLKKTLQNKEVRGIFTKWIKGVQCHNSGIFFDILYHHLITLEYLFDSKINIKYKKYFMDNTSGIINGNINFVPFIMEGSSNNLFRLFNNSIRIETTNETYIIEEKSNIISVSTNETEITDNSETIFYCLKEFLDGNFKNVEDFDIIGQLEK